MRAMEQLWTKEQQQQIITEKEDNEEVQDSYHAAQRAAVEAAAVGREITQEISKQGETLSRADVLADRNKFILEKANRKLRGMTWTGWAANLITSDVRAPSSRKRNDQKGLDVFPDSMCTVGMSGMAKKETFDLVNEYSKEYPEEAVDAVQAMKNYHYNVMLLYECTSADQRMACLAVCRSLRKAADKELQALDYRKDNNAGLVTIYEWLAAISADLKAASLEPNTSGDCIAPEKNKSFSSQELEGLRHARRYKEETICSIPSSVNDRLAAQEAHLDALTPCLDELRHLSESMGSALQEQNTLLGTLHEKSDDLTDRTKQVVRRAELMTHWFSYKKPKLVLDAVVTIQHIDTSRYMTVDGDLVKLSDRFMLDASTFKMWRGEGGRGNLIGLQNKLTERWLGQTLMGGITCSSTNCGQRERWEVDENMLAETRLICASANWGAGGWVRVQGRDATLSIGREGENGKVDGALWFINPTL